MAILKDLIVHGAARVMNTLFAKKVIADELEGNLRAVDVIQDSTHRFTTDAEKTTWNGKASTAVASQSANGLMAAADKKKLDEVATGANNYSHPNSGATAGTYRSVSINTQGHVTGGTNPTTLAGYGITDAAAKTHTHTKSQITDFPTSLKNPNALTISLNGSSQGAYDGLAAKNINVTAASVGAAPSTATRTLTATATASGWSASAPYTQTINVAGITSSDNPVIGLSLPTNTTAANEKLIKKAYSCLSSAVTNNGSITLYCAGKKPVTNFTFFIKGI